MWDLFRKETISEKVDIWVSLLLIILSFPTMGLHTKVVLDNDLDLLSSLNWLAFSF